MIALSKSEERKEKMHTVNCFLRNLAVVTVLLMGTVPQAIKAEQAPQGPSWLSKSDEDNSSGSRSLIVMAQGLGGTLAVFFLGLAIYQRKFQKLSPLRERQLIIKERLPLTPKTSLALIECNGKRLICAVGPDPVTLLDQSTFMDDLLTEQHAEDEKILENVHILDVPARVGSI